MRHIPARETRSAAVATVHREREAERAEQTFLRPRALAPPVRPFPVTGAGGGPLDDRTRRAMTQRLGHDFSKVRVFADANAAASARALNALAYTVGDHIVFGDQQYSPRTRRGQALLAHELTHVAQQRRDGAPAVQRKGGTARGFFANIFQFWDYSKETLDEYLETLNRTHAIVGDFDSDDMARQIAAEWKADRSAYDLTPKLRVLLIREMLDGAVFKSDQEGILTLLEESTNTELKAMIGPGPERILYGEIHPDFGVLKARLELFDKEVLSRLPHIKEPPEEGKPLLETLEEKEEETGLRVEHVSLSFRIAPGALHKSFLANIVVPEKGAGVTIRITRKALRIDIDPGIVLDIIGPVNPTLRGVDFRFKGLKPELDVDAFRETANEKVYEFLRELLAGTRFAGSDYDFSRDPHLLSEIKDPTVIGDINRVKYNLQKSTAGKEETADEDGLKEKALERISGAGAELKVVHTQGARFPEQEEGWGIQIPPATEFTLRLETEGKAAELAEKDIKLARLGVRSTGVLVVRGTEDILEIRGFDILPGLEFQLYGLRALKDLKEVMKEERPGKWTERATEAMSAYDAFTDFLNALGRTGEPRSDVALRLAQWLGERELRAKGMYFVRLYWSTIRDFTGMTDAQLSQFFGVPAPRTK